LWGGCPVSDFKEDPSKGMYFFDDFMLAGNADMSSAYKNSIGQWSVYGYAGAVEADGTAEGGVLKIGANDDQEGVALQSAAGAFRMVTTSTLALNGKLWFECRIARSTVATLTGDIFAGLMTPNLSSNLPRAAYPITATDDTLATSGDFFGFHLTSSSGTRGGPTEAAVAFELASGTVNYPTNLTTLLASTGNSVLTAGTFVKLGFLFDPFAAPKMISAATARQTVGTVRKALIRFFVNGIEAPTFLTTDDVQNATAAQAFPTGFMSPVLAVMNTAGSSPITLNIDWVRVAQAANS